jgi:hypothetical protein
MKLINVFKQTILNEFEKKKNKGVTLVSKIVGDRLITLTSTYHQRTERFGNLDYDSIVDLYNEYLETRKSKFDQPPRLAVPDNMIVTTFENKLDNIYNSFETIKPENQKLIFVKRRKDNEDDGQFNFMEFLISKDGSFFHIITSAFSKDGQFIKTKNEKDIAKRVTLEQRTKNIYTIVYL